MPMVRVLNSTARYPLYVTVPADPPPPTRPPGSSTAATSTATQSTATESAAPK